MKYNCQDNDSRANAKFNNITSSNRTFRKKFTNKEKNKENIKNKGQENNNTEVMRFSFANNISFREIKQIGDKSSFKEERESLSDFFESSKSKGQKQETSKIPRRNILSKEFFQMIY